MGLWEDGTKSAGSFLSDPLGINSAAAGLEAQTQAAAAANATQRYIYDTTRQDMAPWRESGMRALAGLDNKDFQQDFDANDFQQDPGYQFRLDEGMKAIERSAAARGGLNSTATMKNLGRFSQGVASDEYGKAYDRFNADRDRRFNRMASLAGIGQTSQGAVNAAGQNYGNNVSSNQIGVGNAQAASGIAQQNQRTGLVQGGIMALAMSSDERVKTNIEPISKADLQELKRTIKPYAYEYLDGKHGDGKFVGVMAQDLEKSKLGRQLVFEIDGVKSIDIKKAISLLLALTAEEAA